MLHLLKSWVNIFLWQCLGLNIRWHWIGKEIRIIWWGKYSSYSEIQNVAKYSDSEERQGSDMESKRYEFFATIIHHKLRIDDIRKLYNGLDVTTDLPGISEQQLWFWPFLPDHPTEPICNQMCSQMVQADFPGSSQGSWNCWTEHPIILHSVSSACQYDKSNY
jgi:hypothetical protein